MTVRIGLIGCGAIARRSHIPAFRKCEDVDLVAFASRSIGSAQAAADEWGSGVVLADWRDVIIRDDIHAIDICSPNLFHRKQAVAATRAGKHVLVEKPIAYKLRDADKMIAAADEAGVVLRVAHNMRYIPALVGAREAVGSLGAISSVRMAFGHSGPRDWAPDSTWFFDPDVSGGGALIDLGIHAIDLVRYVTGLEVSRVAAMTVGSESVEDAAHVIMQFDTGAAGYVQASWVARPAPDFAMAIFGAEGTLRLDATKPPAVRKATGEKVDVALPTDVSNPYADFVGEITGATPPGPALPASAADGRAALAIVSAAYESARTGRTVEVAR